MNVYHDPQIAHLLFEHRPVENGMIKIAHPPIYQTSERVYLGKKENGDPQLLFLVRKTRDPVYPNAVTADQFREMVTKINGEDKDNPWTFREFDERYDDGSGYVRDHAAIRNFKPEDLLNNGVLLYHFVDRTRFMFKKETEWILKRKTGASEETTLRERLTAFNRANDLLRKTFESEKKI